MLLKCFFWAKNIISYAQSVFHPRVRQAIKRADKLVAAVPSAQERVRQYYGKDIEFLGETGSYPLVEDKPVNKQEGFNLLWVGKFDYCKMLHLALRIMHQLKDYKDIKLHIYGSGNKEQQERYHKMAMDLALQDSVIWCGKVSHNQMLQEMRKNSMLLFTSISEGTPAVLMEALQNKLPVVCFDTCGMAPVVDDSIGKKIKLTNPAQSVHDFAEAILYHYQHPEILQQKAEACIDKADTLSWSNKTHQMLEWYRQAIENFKQKNTAKS